MTIVSLLSVDHFGRKRLLLAGTALMTAGITILGISTLAMPAETSDPCTVHTLASDPGFLPNVLIPNAKDKVTTTEHTVTQHYVFTTESINNIISTINPSMELSTTAPPLLNNTALNDSDVSKHKRDSESQYLHIKKLDLESRESQTLSVIDNSENTTNLSNSSDSSGSNGQKWLSLSALMLYIAGYAVGFGPGRSSQCICFVTTKF